ncbi:hypothetical protein D3C81_793250 [compost metagenome]
MANIHDNEIISYNVDLKNHKITIQTVQNPSRKSISIVFHDVLAHLFETQLEDSIILDITKYELSLFINENRELLEKHRKSCWPMEYNTFEELEKKLMSEQYGYYVILSSYGLNGWVLAKNHEILNDK